MANMSKVKHELCLKQWEQLINQCSESGMTVKRWCDENNISKDAYYYWLKLVRERAVDQLPTVVKNSLPLENPTDGITFKKLEVQSPVAGLQPAVMVHVNGATIEVPNGAARETVEAVLLALKSLC